MERVPTVKARGRKAEREREKEEKGAKRWLSKPQRLMNRIKSFQRTGTTTAKKRMIVQSKKRPRKEGLEILGRR